MDSSGIAQSADDLTDSLRRELARVLDENSAAEDLSEHANLMEAGLHSLAILRLIEPLSKLAGIRLDYADLARRPSLAAWRTVLDQARARPD